MRLGDHMMFIQLQLSTQTGARRTRPSPVQLPTPHSMTVHDHQEVPSPTYTPDAGSNGIPYNLHQFRSFPESEKVNSAHGALRNVKTKIIIRFSFSLSLSFVWTRSLLSTKQSSLGQYQRKTCFPVVRNVGTWNDESDFFFHETQTVDIRPTAQNANPLDN